MPSFLKSRISAGLQSDIQSSFLAGAQVGAQQAATRAAYEHEAEKTRILAASQAVQAKLKADADNYKARLDSAEKYFTEAAKYYDDGIGQLENQLLQNGQRYSPDQRRGIATDIDRLRSEKSKILGQRSAMFGGPTFQAPNTTTTVLSQYSPEYEESQKNERTKKQYEAAEAGYKADAAANAFNLSGGMTTDYGEYISGQNYNLNASKILSKPQELIGSYGQKLAAGQVGSFENEREQLAGDFAAFDTGAEKMKLYNPYLKIDEDYDRGRLINERIAPAYERLGAFVQRNLTPEEQGIASYAGLKFNRHSWADDRSLLRDVMSRGGQDAGVAQNLYFKLGFGR